MKAMDMRAILKELDEEKCLCASCRSVELNNAPQDARVLSSASAKNA